MLPRSREKANWSCMVDPMKCRVLMSERDAENASEIAKDGRKVNERSGKEKERKKAPTGGGRCMKGGKGTGTRKVTA